jgi:PEP-CTERM motif
MTFTATSASELREFASLGAPSGQPPVALLDGVSMTGLTGAVPEPGMWAMMGLGFAGLGLVAYRRRRKAPSRSADLKPKSEQDRGRPLAAAAEANALVTFK